MHWNNELFSVAQAYELGEIHSSISLEGGLTHQCYHVQTDEGEFVIKHLNPFVMRIQSQRECYHKSEEIAQKLQLIANTVPAIPRENNILYRHDDQYFMLFPFVSGKVLLPNKITLKHIAYVAQTLCRIHNVNIKIDHPPPVDFSIIDFHSQTSTVEEIQTLLHKILPLVDKIYERYLSYEQVLKNNLVVSHRDCYPKNILWDEEGNLHTIDWESAGLINKTQDVITTVIYWSLDDDYQISMDKLNHFLNYYQQNGGEIVTDEIEAGFYGMLANWLGWLDFNLSRIKHGVEFELGMMEAKKTLLALPIVCEQLMKTNLMVLSQKRDC